MFLDGIEFEEKELAYLCGFFATDGCLHKGSLSISQCEANKELIEWWAVKLKAKVSVRPPCKYSDEDFNFKTPHYRIDITRPELYAYMLELGITPRKSLTLDVSLDSQSDEFKWYFLRGAIDGDGCVYLEKENVKSRFSRSGIQICGASKKFLETLQRIFGGYLTPAAPTKKGNMLYILYFKGVRGQNLAKYLPKDEFTLGRKTESILKFLQMKARTRYSSVYLQGEIWNNPEYEVSKHWIQLYKEIENPVVSLRTVKHRIHDYGWPIDKALTEPPGIHNRGKFSTKKRKYK